MAQELKHTLLLVQSENQTLQRLSFRIHSFLATHQIPADITTCPPTDLNYQNVILLQWSCLANQLGKLQPATRLITCIYDHTTWKSNKNFKHLTQVLGRTNQLFVANRLLLTEFQGLSYKPALLQDGVDTDIFQYYERKPFTASNQVMATTRKPVIGWVGNTRVREKRYQLAADLQSKFSHLMEFRFAVGDVAYSDMPKWYQAIDVLLVTSSSEGTPNPFLEILATGGTYVAPPIGVVYEIHEKTRGGILVENNDFGSAIRHCLECGSSFSEWGRANRKFVETNWRWNMKLEPLLHVLT